MVLLVLLSLSGARSVRALDVFTLWRQPELPLRIAPGDWVEYRGQSLAGGRREETLTRVACLAEDGEGRLLLELVPLEDVDGALRPVAGEGVRLEVSRDLRERRGTFVDAIVSAVQWRGGEAVPLGADELRDDPLVAASLASDFVPDSVTPRDPTTRIVLGRQFLCDQWVMAAADTQEARLPAGLMRQVTTREIVAAVHPDIPFLGLTYVSERIRAESELDPPSRRLKPPPPRVRVDVLELVGFGTGAQPVLGPVD
ncbi:hypothetical protein KDM41_01655 [bacterium]|nr:hypothetical protein [bacterium]